MPSFSIALSGLQANTTALSTIGNDLANLNTTAFKNQTANFEDLFYQNIGTSGSSAPLQVGVGTRVSSINSDFTQGNLAPTGNATDMALNGSGFFVVNDSGTQELTRNGNFQLSPQGNLITSDGLGVQGYPTLANGDINLNAPLQTLNIPLAKTQLAQASSEFSLNTNLDSSAAVGAAFTSSVGIYDSLGDKHNANITFTKTGTSSWSYAVSLPTGEATSTSGNTGTLTFNPDGTLASPSGNVSGITFSGLADNAANMSLNWKLYDGNGNSLVTQGAAASSTNGNSQDGYASGIYKNFSVDATGIVTANFTNGGTETIGQLAVATVADPQSLTRSGNALYSINRASGEMNLGTADTGGRGSISDNSLEQSNVDISTEFAALIVAQRAFQANSKTVTTFDTITQDTINMIR